MSYTLQDFSMFNLDGAQRTSRGYSVYTTVANCMNSCNMESDCVGFSRLKSDHPSSDRRCLFYSSFPSRSVTVSHPNVNMYVKNDPCFLDRYKKTEAENERNRAYGEIATINNEKNTIIGQRDNAIRERDMFKQANTECDDARFVLYNDKEALRKEYVKENEERLKFENAARDANTAKETAILNAKEASRLQAKAEADAKLSDEQKKQADKDKKTADAAATKAGVDAAAAIKDANEKIEKANKAAKKAKEDAETERDNALRGQGFAETARLAAVNAKEAALAEKRTAEDAARAAEVTRLAAVAAKDAAERAKNDALSGKGTAEAAARAAETARLAAVNAKADALTEKRAAEAARDAAEAAKAAANAERDAALTGKGAAEAAKDAAEKARDEAIAARAVAEKAIADKIAAEKEAAKKAATEAWIKAARPGCRNLVTTSSTILDSFMLNHNIKCNDDEYISGYRQVNDIYNYTCCRVPIGNLGVKGLPGFDGDKGERGVKGNPGYDGDRGPEGKIGPAGPRGIQGPKGPVGPVGQPGSGGHILQVAGPVGPMGPDGPAGPMGPKGIRGKMGPQRIFNNANEDDVLSLLDMQDRIRDTVYSNHKHNANKNEHSQSLMQGKSFQFTHRF